MSKNNPATVEVELWCHHRLLFPKATMPRMGERLWCPRCQQYRKVTGEAHQYAARCRVCRYARYYGIGREAAIQAAIRHRGRYPRHTVDVRSERGIVETFSPLAQWALPGMGTSPYDSPPPF